MTVCRPFWVLTSTDMVVHLQHCFTYSCALIFIIKISLSQAEYVQAAEVKFNRTCLALIICFG